MLKNDNRLSGFVKIHRSMLDWEWFDNSNTFHVFMYFLLSANFKDAEWHGKIVKKGDFICSISSISKNTGLSIKSVRVALNHLKTTNEVAIKTASKYSVVTLINYSKYQDLIGTTASETASTGANKGQTKGKQRANKGQQRKNDKNDKNDKNTNSSANAAAFAEFWERYPKKEAKTVALKSFQKINPNDELFAIIIHAVENQKNSAKWINENGKYIPMPSTWLNQRRWEDVVETEKPKMQMHPKKDMEEYQERVAQEPIKYIKKADRGNV
jgi:hypothetical protein